MGYHVNPETGMTGKCKATTKCPFGLSLEEHYTSEASARYAYESSMAAETFRSLSKDYSPQQLRAMPSEVLRKIPLKEMDASQLAQALQSESVAVGMDREIIQSCVNLAAILHAHQRRGNRGNFMTTPYIEHPLRNAVRLLRLGVKDQNVIVAAVLHDTIEDGAKVFVEKFNRDYRVAPEPEARKALGGYIDRAYGSEVLELVEAVTNDYVADTDKSKQSLSEKNRIYLEHVKAAIRNRPGVILVKLSDFTDNATGLYHNDIPGREAKTFKQATKYLPVVDVFLEELDRTELPISKESLESLKQQLKTTECRLRKIIERHSSLAK